ncbi:hypothetical protein GQ600_6301 [Phytophthora cactorum]|nr:hypothetical protein GQ600_6301 [Phytophthora cactorum]
MADVRSRTNCSVDCYMLALINILSVVCIQEFATRRSEQIHPHKVCEIFVQWLAMWAVRLLPFLPQKISALPTLYSDGGKRAWRRKYAPDGLMTLRGDRLTSGQPLT